MLNNLFGWPFRLVVLLIERSINPSRLIFSAAFRRIKKTAATVAKTHQEFELLQNGFFGVKDNSPSGDVMMIVKLRRTVLALVKQDFVCNIQKRYHDFDLFDARKIQRPSRNEDIDLPPNCIWGEQDDFALISYEIFLNGRPKISNKLSNYTKNDVFLCSFPGSLFPFLNYFFRSQKANTNIEWLISTSLNNCWYDFKLNTLIPIHVAGDFLKTQSIEANVIAYQ